MKRILFFLVCVLPLLSMGQTTLNPGDIVIVAINGDTDATYGRGFSFMPLVNLEAGTEIYFTDYGWSDVAGAFINSTAVSDVFVKYTAPGGGVTAGTVIRNATNLTTNFAFYFAYGISTYDYVNIVGVAASDEVIAFQGSIASPTLLFAASYVSTAVVASSWATGVAATGGTNGVGSALPGTGSGSVVDLVDDVTALSFNQLSTGNDNCAYVGTIDGTGPTDKAGWQARISNYANWTFNDAIPIPTPMSGSYTVVLPNSAPTDIALSATSVNENVTENTTVGTISTTDADAGNTFTYTLVSGTGSTDNASFNINGTSLRLTSSPDFEAQSSYSVRIRTTDQGNLIYEEAFTITINDIAEPPTTTTQVVSNIAATTATGNGNITILGQPSPTAYGVCWNTTGTPTTSDNKVDNGAASATGAFTTAMTGLTANTTYYVRAFATNTAGTSYGTEVSFTTSILTVTWNGTSWTPSTPTALDDAVINANYNSTGITCNNLTINSGFQVTFSSDVTVAGNLLVKSGASVINNGAVTVTGTTAIQQDLTGSGTTTPNGRFWYISSPVTGATSATFDAAGTNILKSYDETNHVWAPITNNTTILPIGTGYFTRLGADQTVSFTGAVNSGNISLSPSRSGTTDAKRGFNLIGNPYPSFLDWDAAYTGSSNLESTMWYRTNNGSAMVFDTYNAALHIGTNNNLNGAVTKDIPPMQAFWVRVDADGNTGTLDFNNTMRNHGTGNLLKDETTQEIIRLQISKDANSDELIFAFNTQAQNGIDSYDSEKMFADIASIPQLYSVVEDQKLVINGLESYITNFELPIGIQLGEAGTYTISAKEIEGLIGVPVILEDKLLHITQDLTTGDYTFTTDAIESTDRFILHLKSDQEATNISDITKSNITINTELHTLIVTSSETSGTIVVTDILGRIIQTKEIKDTKTSMSLPIGIYIVKVQTNNSNASEQVIIK